MKYMLDWAEGPSTQNINFTFPLPFRELNLRKDMEYSLEELLHQFFPCMKTSEITNYEQYKILIVLDGFDECRLDLNFRQYSILKDIQQKTTVSNLLMNLIVGNLLPEAQVWITSRPAASQRIPNDKVHRVTEVRGFNDEQKEEYFRKRFDPDLAEKILLCLKQSRSIYLMGYIPVFSWITANVLESFVQHNQQVAPKTLTDLFIHFLLLQCRQANSKYNEASEEDSKIWNERNVKTILGLSKLAFKQLEKGDLLFTEEDLESCGLDVEATVYSGLLTKVKRNESELYPKPLFSFVHLSIQEFLSAFHVSYMFNNMGENVFCSSSNESDSSCSASDFYKSAVDKALKSDNGDWDLFLRFLLGLSLKTNQDLMNDLIKNSENTVQVNEETIAYIKTKIDEGSGDADMSMNLFHCLNELNDHSLVEEIKKYLHSEKNDYENFSPSKWSALTFVLLTSDEKLDVFDLKKYFKSEKVLLGMMPVVKVATKALLSWCELSELSCTGLSTSVLMSSSSNLTELDLSHNELMDSGVAKLSEGVKSFHCKLRILRLAGCRISAEGCSSLTSALRSNRSSHLEELDLSYNHPGPEGQNLKALENDPNATLKKVCLDHCCEHRLKPGLKKYTADLTFDGRFKHPRIIVEGQKARTWKNVTEKIPEANGVSVRHVFCEQELSGLCYWELEWDGTVGIGVSYKGAATKSVIGSDDNSWAVFCSNQPHSCLEFDKCAKQAHTQKRPHRKICEFPSQKMALYLNWEAGTLSYYSVIGKELTLITTFKATAFKKPLVPTFWLHSGSVSLDYVTNETEPQ
uniref:B30.2/SPRY domain-containing protein n=1 Tax=Neogobius melanostomus TaxID=47308 RepID=A0A8C6TRW5_9GOBI